MSKLTPPSEVNWVNRPIIKMHDNPPADSQWEYHVWMPDWLAEWDVFGGWEVERFNSMRDNLKQGDVLFDIGAELGWQSIIYAQFVGPGSMVLVEPTAELWPNIMHTWQRNFGKPPLACYFGLFSDVTTSNFTLPLYTFPAESEGGLIDKLTYRYIHEHGVRMPQMKLDDYVKISGIKPDALTIDTEGSELLILGGSEETLRSHDLKVWVSIHPELAKKDYGVEPAEVVAFMSLCGYRGERLATDHEEHWYFRKARK